jgi:hypothetical protein
VRFFLSSHTVRVVKRENGEKQIYKLDQLPNQQDFFDILQNFLNYLNQQPVVDNGKQNTIQVNQINIDVNKRIIAGIVDSGSYGINSKLVNIHTQQTSYLRNPDDAEILPFYFMFYLPKDRDEGIFLIENIGRYETKKAFCKVLRDFTSSKYDGISVDINKLIPSQLLDHFLSKSKITKLKFIKYKFSSDKFDTLSDTHIEEDMNITKETTFRASNLPIFDKVKQAISNKKAVKQLFELEEVKDYDRVKIELKIGQTTKTIDLENCDDFNNSIDITDELVIDPVTGHPTIDSLKSTFCVHLTDVCEQIYGDQQLSNN